MSFVLSAEALDAKQQTVAINNHIEIESRQPELLPAPQLLTKDKILKAGESGDIHLKWKPVTGAARYIVEISGEKTNFRKEVSSTQIKMNNLLPGNHSLVLTAVDKIGRQGTKSQSVTIEVPNVSGIAAPTTKGIRIK